MFSCRKAFHLLSESHDRKLTWFESFRYAFHLLICGSCRKVKKQMIQILSLSKTHPEFDDCELDVKLPEQARTEIEQSIKNHLKEK